MGAVLGEVGVCVCGDAQLGHLLQWGGSWAGEVSKICQTLSGSLSHTHTHQPKAAGENPRWLFLWHLKPREESVKDRGPPRF